jgi:hypothetical protein
MIVRKRKKVDKKGDTQQIDICSKLTNLRLNLIQPNPCAYIAVERSKD